MKLLKTAGLVCVLGLVWGLPVQSWSGSGTERPARLRPPLMAEPESPGIQSLHFDTSGWEVRESRKDRIIWTNDRGDLLGVTLAPHSLNLPPLSDNDAVIELGRQLARPGGIISIAVVNVKPVRAVQLICKQERGTGYIYTGMLLIPFKGLGYYIVATFLEHGTTGVREAVVTAQLVKEGKLKVEEYEEKWFQDPYDPAYEGVVLRSISDDEQYDEMFPDHPLSKLRQMMQRIRRTLTFDEEILKEIDQPMD